MDPITHRLVETVRQITSQYITENPETFTTTRREVMNRRGMDDDYRARLKKFREDPKNAAALSPFLLPSVEDQDLDRPVKINYGPLGSFPGDPTPDKNEKAAGGTPAGGWARRGGDIRIMNTFSPDADFIMGELIGNQQLLNPRTKDAVELTRTRIPNVGQEPVTTKNYRTRQTVQAISTYPELKDTPYDIIGHEASHTAQPKIDLSNSNKRVVGPLPGDTPENKEYRDYLFNKTEPAARANEYKAWLKARGSNVNADMSSDEYKKAIDTLRKSNETNPDNTLGTDLEFYNTPQGEALFRGAKANTNKDDPTKNKPLTTPSVPTAIAETWSAKYKRSIDCKHPRGFSQRAHCAGRKKTK